MSGLPQRRTAVVSQAIMIAWPPCRAAHARLRPKRAAYSTTSISESADLSADGAVVGFGQVAGTRRSPETRRSP